MKKDGEGSKEMVRLNSAAFRLGSEAGKEECMEQLLDETLARICGGGVKSSECTEFNCNLFVLIVL